MNEEKAGWISVKDNPPAIDCGVLVSCNGVVSIGYRMFEYEDPCDYDVWHVLDDDLSTEDVQYWMPLPPAPEKERL